MAGDCPNRDCKQHTEPKLREKGKVWLEGYRTLLFCYFLIYKNEMQELQCKPVVFVCNDVCDLVAIC